MRSEIHVFSGLGSSLFPSLSYGTRTLEKLIDALPYAEAEHHVWNRWKPVADGIVNRWKQTKEPFKTVLIGHSNGVIATTSIAEYLGTRGLFVVYIGAIDPTAGAFPIIGRNVAECSEFHAFRGWPAITRRMTNNRRGALHFTNAWPGIHRLWHIPGAHVAVASSPRVHKIILDDLARVLG